MIKDGLWFHAYYVKEKRTNSCKWGRGNGWVAVATVEVLSAMPENHPQFKKIKHIMRKHIEGLKQYQDEYGLR